MEADIKNFNHHMWYSEEDGIITIGINDEGLADITEITAVDLPTENENVAAEVAIGTIETDDGPLDVYSPVAGKVVEVNTQVLDEPSLIQEDNYEEGWLIRIEASEEIDADDEDDDEDDLDEEEELEEDEEE